MNVWTFSGNLGRDAEQRVTKGGTEIVQFSVAVRAGYGDNEKTTWVRCSMFGKRGQAVAPYLNKGQQVVVSGEAHLHSWENKDGEEKHSMELRVNDVTLVGGKPEKKAEPKPAPAAPAQDNFEDDIPF